MSLCGKCNREFPDELLSPITSNSPDVPTALLCAPCAYEIINQAHGVKNLKPTPGSVAEWMYQEAKKLYPDEEKQSE